MASLMLEPSSSTSDMVVTWEESNSYSLRKSTDELEQLKHINLPYIYLMDLWSANGKKNIVYIELITAIWSRHLGVNQVFQQKLRLGQPLKWPQSELRSSLLSGLPYSFNSHLLRHVHVLLLVEDEPQVELRDVVEDGRGEGQEHQAKEQVHLERRAECLSGGNHRTLACSEGWVWTLGVSPSS